MLWLSPVFIRCRSTKQNFGKTSVEVLGKTCVKVAYVFGKSCVKLWQNFLKSLAKYTILGTTAKLQEKLHKTYQTFKQNFRKSSKFKTSLKVLWKFSGCIPTRFCSHFSAAGYGSTIGCSKGRSSIAGKPIVRLRYICCQRGINGAYSAVLTCGADAF